MKQKPLFWAFLAGAALIVGIRLASPGVDGAVAAAVVASIVVAWLGFYYRSGEIKERDRAGDDLYYLGLLLTLVSLIYALVWLFIVSDAEDVQARVDTLIGNFGIALVSTVAGILGRILLQDASGERFDPTTARTEGEAPRQPAQEAAQGEQETLLTEAMREGTANMLELRQQLREAADAFAHFTRVTLSQADHTKSHTQALIDNFNQHMATTAERQLDATAAVWQRMAEALGAEGERLLSHIDEAVSDATKRTADAWRGLADGFDAASASARQRLDADVEEMARMLERLATANGALEVLADSLDGAQGHVSALAETASGATASLQANTSAALAGQRTLAEGAKAAQRATLESFEAAAAALADATGKQMAAQARAWQRAVEDFDAAAQAHREQSERAMATTQRTVDALVGSLEAAGADVATLGRTAAGAATGAEAHMADILKTLNGLAEGAREQQEASLGAWRDAASRFSEDARAQLASEMAAWRALVEGFKTAESAQALSEETSRLADLVERLDGLLNANRTTRNAWFRR